ncbi:D-lactate dehydrogenase [Phenylobacterium sp. LjRoot225]|uniref:D-lactate dehydrogenase n=1 Tax=Phenylobacterium sp. LjRoot225 TaxID=3342285 RepID=UPI003ECCD886
MREVPFTTRRFGPADSGALVATLRTIVGRRHVLTGPATVSAYATGYRTGGGPVAAVVRPGSLIEQWRVFQACVAADHIVIAQAANTGLTGGSTPCGDYDRPVVIINTLRIKGVFPLSGGREVVCLSGATLHELERVLSPLRREPHSVIGSSCLGASVVGGICNNSGGTLVARGPAYTEYALYAQVEASGEVVLRNHLGLRLGDDPERILAALDAGAFGDLDLVDEGRAASAKDYEGIVRDIDAQTPARFNADRRRLYEASGSAGKVMVFAVRVDSFAKAERPTTFYIGSNASGDLTAIRRRMLAECPFLPISAEYIHREAFDIAARYGKDTVLAIRWLGVQRLPRLFQLKAWVDRLAKRALILPADLSDHLLQAASRLFPDHLPRRIRQYRDRFEHHLILKIPEAAAPFVRTLLGEMFPSPQGEVFECSPEEAERAFQHRFAVAGAAVRYRAIHRCDVEDIAAVDIALRRDDRDWFERLPATISDRLVAKLYYGHFFCHVFHQDYVVRKGVSAMALEHEILALIEQRGGEFPAEHNVGHLYCAKPELAGHYRRLDPGNRLNPGIGHTSRNRDWMS